MCGKLVAAVELVYRSGFEVYIVEAEGAALTQRVLRSATVAHMAVAVVLGVAELECVVDIPFGEVDNILKPSLGTPCVDVVVVAEAVALAHVAVGVVEVVLQVVGFNRDFAVAEGVDIEPEFAAEQVANGLVVRALGVVERNTALKGHPRIGGC